MLSVSLWFQMYLFLATYDVKTLHIQMENSGNYRGLAQTYQCYEKEYSWVLMFSLKYLISSQVRVMGPQDRRVAEEEH